MELFMWCTRCNISNFKFALYWVRNEQEIRFWTEALPPTSKNTLHPLFKHIDIVLYIKKISGAACTKLRANEQAAQHLCLMSLTKLGTCPSENLYVLTCTIQGIIYFLNFPTLHMQKIKADERAIGQLAYAWCIWWALTHQPCDNITWMSSWVTMAFYLTSQKQFTTDVQAYYVYSPYSAGFSTQWYCFSEPCKDMLCACQTCSK